MCAKHGDHLAPKPAQFAQNTYTFESRLEGIQGLRSRILGSLNKADEGLRTL